MLFLIQVEHTFNYFVENTKYFLAAASQMRELDVFLSRTVHDTKLNIFWFWTAVRHLKEEGYLGLWERPLFNIYIFTDKMSLAAK